MRLVSILSGEFKGADPTWWKKNELFQLSFFENAAWDLGIVYLKFINYQNMKH